MSVAEEKSVYEQLGGAPAMAAAVEVFYRKVLADERISHFFEDVDMERQSAKQKAFLTLVTGGPVHYSGRDMRAGHAPLVRRGLNDTHFDAVAGHLKETLEELGVPAPLVAKVLAIAESTRADVLNR
ncbi:group 1 truncated hemoglobin [Comamonas sp. JC664]|uniref:group I truncated hemoglobin n=1 Tax=Comamonas sp. JC664 TaxID=2801917 RepID=UPI001748A287|nr:group 1 truncated hemoglobin [Comamonas sp. JC664]MBL0698990.1 group 1 truncated hemoglobin [Comamonas sp. JC664]GHG79945.1 group 1 truncated hemoglobin [Comamonas sp. KCTC 72670]